MCIWMRIWFDVIPVYMYIQADESTTISEDAATVLRALAVSNFNHDLTCLVQVLRPEERVVLRDSDISVILCLEEYKTALQVCIYVCVCLCVYTILYIFIGSECCMSGI